MMRERDNEKEKKINLIISFSLSRSTSFRANARNLTAPADRGKNEKIALPLICFVQRFVFQWAGRRRIKLPAHVPCSRYSGKISRYARNDVARGGEKMRVREGKILFSHYLRV
jgi:hypothetical protein